MSKAYTELLAQVRTGELALPSPPTAYVEISQILNRTDFSTSEVAESISKNPALTATILQMANSPALRIGASITSISGAIAVVGTLMIKNIVLSLTVKGKFKSKNFELNVLLHENWKHSVEASVRMSILAPKFNLRPEAALVIGILHDISILPIIAYYELKKIDCPVEEELLELLDSDLSADILVMWGLDLVVVDSVRHRDYTQEELAISKLNKLTYSKLLFLVHLSIEDLDLFAEVVKSIGKTDKEVESILDLLQNEEYFNLYNTLK